jgi:hypothetical protein
VSFFSRIATSLDLLLKTPASGAACTNEPTNIEKRLTELRIAIDGFVTKYDANNEEEKAAARCNQTWNRVTTAGVIVYTLITAVIMIISTCQYRLVRQQLVGEQAANVQVTAAPGDDGIHVSFSNIGRINAKDVYTQIRIEKFSWPDLKTIASQPVHEISLAVLGTSDAGNNNRDRTYRLEPGWWPKDWDTFLRLKTSVRVYTEFTYDNGFGDSIKQSDCRAWVPTWNAKTAHGSVGGGGMEPCENFPADIKGAISTQENAAKGIQP